jgi:hypothetical protein
MLRPPTRLIAALGVAAIAFAADVTIVVDFEGPHSERSVEQMKRETAEIVKDSGLHLEWRAREQVGGNSYPNLVLVRFTGRCVLEPVPVLYDERGPFAFTYGADGDVLPFTEVACDHVRASVQSAMGGDDYARPDYLMGRALGRVVAHELVHILTRSRAHGQGVAGPNLSGRELIGAPLRLSRRDVERLRCKAGLPACAEREAR